MQALRIEESRHHQDLRQLRQRDERDGQVRTARAARVDQRRSRHRQSRARPRRDVQVLRSAQCGGCEDLLAVQRRSDRGRGAPGGRGAGRFFRREEARCEMPLLRRDESGHGVEVQQVRGHAPRGSTPGRSTESAACRRAGCSESRAAVYRHRRADRGGHRVRAVVLPHQRYLGGGAGCAVAAGDRDHGRAAGSSTKRGAIRFRRARPWARAS